jgi:hypothetical protein
MAAALQQLQTYFADPACPKLLFESKRCFTELMSWGVGLAGVEGDVLLAAFVTDPDRWNAANDGKRKRPSCLVQSGRLGEMVAGLLNVELGVMEAALAGDKAWSEGREGEQQQQQQEKEGGPGDETTLAVSGGDQQPVAGSKRRRAPVRSKSSTIKATRTTSSSSSSSQAGGLSPQLLAVHAWAVHQLHEVLLRQLASVPSAGSAPGGSTAAGSTKLLDVYRSVELPLQQVLSAMEREGIAVDAAVLEEQQQDIQVG